MNMYGNAKKNSGDCCGCSLCFSCAFDDVCVRLDPRRFSWNASFDHLFNSVQGSVETSAVGKTEHIPGAQEQVASFMALMLGLRLLIGEGRLLLRSQKPR